MEGRGMTSFQGNGRKLRKPRFWGFSSERGEDVQIEAGELKSTKHREEGEKRKRNQRNGYNELHYRELRKSPQKY